MNWNLDEEKKESIGKRKRTMKCQNVGCSLLTIDKCVLEEYYRWCVDFIPMGCLIITDEIKL